MSADELGHAEEKKKPLPRWLVIPVIVASGGVTAAAMSMTGLRGPALAWERANHSIEEAWYGEQRTASAEEAPRMASPGSPPGGGVLPVAGVPAVPTIIAGAPATHVDRGPCTTCHSVVSAQGTPVPAIYSQSAMTHEYRGMCGNCHQSRVAPTFGTPVAAVVPPPPAAAAPKQPQEAEWQGLEVGPGTLGVVVRSTEGTARRLGMQMGDVVTSINAVPVRTMADFVRVTDNGALAQGAVIVRRDAQRLAFEFSGSPPAAQPAAAKWGATPVVLPPPNTQF